MSNINNINDELINISSIKYKETIKLNNESDVKSAIKELIALSNKFESIFDKTGLYKLNIDLEKLLEVKKISVFIKKCIYTIQLYTLENNLNVASLNRIINIIETLIKLQELLVDSMFSLCTSNKFNDNLKQSIDEYRKILSFDIKKLN